MQVRGDGVGLGQGGGSRSGEKQLYSYYSLKVKLEGLLMGCM